MYYEFFSRPYIRLTIQNKDIPEFKNIRQYENHMFEIQVRTLNQHAWSNASHKLSYKHDGDLPHELQRKLYRLLALYELADQEIENINILKRKKIVL